jgi:hypothetical protein
MTWIGILHQSFLQFAPAFLTEGLSFGIGISQGVGKRHHAALVLAMTQPVRMAQFVYGLFHHSLEKFPPIFTQTIKLRIQTYERDHGSPSKLIRQAEHEI